MKKHTITVLLYLLVTTFGFAQNNTTEFLVQPYLQDATPNSMTIMWETSTGEESVVEYGLTPKLGKKAQGKAYDIAFAPSRVHEVNLQALKRFTTYYYRVKTGKAVSEVFQFKTPPFANDHESFNIIAMSDMQKDRNEPNKWGEVVHDGVLAYLKKHGDGGVSDRLALVMIPGDLVENGTKYEQWKQDFFTPAGALFSQVPLYPVPGNHEKNSDFFFKYFKLPENGTAAYAEHWWYTDYGNTRIIGLDSNSGYRDIEEQYSWLEQVLEDAAKNPDIDFVFAQLHHPYKSELWLPGEETTTGKVVQLLETFSTTTGKPSLHFFGHTHGYSRGQSKDHRHLWINVATAGGAIDNWGEFEGMDYNEFTVTQDEYGFVMVEVNADVNDPSFTIKRISRGNEKGVRDNVLTDSITVYRKERKPETPKTVAPTHADLVAIEGAVLRADTFKSPYKEAFHAASHWQVSASENFEKLELDRWIQHENWYYLENRQQHDDLTDEKTERLEPNTTYYWRVRYRDQNLHWSDWSATAQFKTKP